MGTFCSNQPFALEIIKTKQKKDSRFASFIQVLSSHFTFCRKIATNVTFLVKIAAGELHSGNSLDVTSLNHSPLATFTVASAPFLPVKTCAPARSLPDPFRFIAFQEAESNRLCRRLQLKDIIPVEMQRLTKYPLLLENIAKYTGTVALLKLLVPSQFVAICKHMISDKEQRGMHGRMEGCLLWL